MISRYEIFMNILETGSFSRSAEKLGYSQSAISQSVKTLEQQLGVTLIKRNREGLQLTADGKQYLPYIRSIASAEKNLMIKQKEMHGFENQVIRIGAFTSVSRNVLPELMASFREKYPTVSFELRQGEYNNIHEWLLDGTIDFGFIQNGLFEDITCETLYKDTMVAVLPEDYACKKLKISLKELTNAPFILLDEGEYSVPLQAFHNAGLQPEVAYKIYDDYTILAMIKEGLGVSILYRLVVKGYEKGLKVLELKEKAEREVALAYRDFETMPQASRTFYQYIIDQTRKVKL